MTKLIVQATFEEQKSSRPRDPNWFLGEVKEILRENCCAEGKEYQAMADHSWERDLVPGHKHLAGFHCEPAYILGDGYEVQSIEDPKYCYNCGAKHSFEAREHIIKRLVTKTRKVKALKEVEVEVDEEYEVLE